MRNLINSPFGKRMFMMVGDCCPPLPWNVIHVTFGLNDRNAILTCFVSGNWLIGVWQDAKTLWLSDGADHIIFRQELIWKEHRVNSNTGGNIIFYMPQLVVSPHKSLASRSYFSHFSFERLKLGPREPAKYHESVLTTLLLDNTNSIWFINAHLNVIQFLNQQ